MVKGLSQFLRKPTAAATVPVTVMGEQFWFTKHGGFPQNQITQCCHHCSCDSQGWVVLVYQVWWVFQEPENQLLLPLLMWQSRMSGSGLPSMVSVLSQYQKTNRCCNCSWVSSPGLPSMVDFLRTRKPTAAAIVPVTVMGGLFWFTKHGECRARAFSCIIKPIADTTGQMTSSHIMFLFLANLSLASSWSQSLSSLLTSVSPHSK